MIKNIVKLLITAALLLLLPQTPALADEIDVESAQSKALGIGAVESALPKEAEDIIGSISVKDALDTDSLINRLLDSAVVRFGGIFSHSVKSAGIILIIAILCSLAAPMLHGEYREHFLPLCGCAAVTAIALGDVKAFIGMGAETLNILSDFSKILLPSIAASASASGAFTSASVKYVAASLFVDILLTACARVVMPLLYSYIAASIAKAAMGGDALGGVCQLLKWLCTSILTLIVAAFTAYIGVTGIISGTSDAIATKAAKSAISAALPVVGGIISDAASTVLAGASILRNALGVFGLIAVACVCLTPFLTLGAQYLLYKAAAGLSCAVSDSRLGALISDIGTAFGIVLGITGAGVIMMFISIISSMRAVTGI